ncbi:Pleckstrin homology domain-containing family B member 2 [Plecturocebus cupreus]
MILEMLEYGLTEACGVLLKGLEKGEEMAFVKSGWLLRQSTILKRWKKNWFDLWSDGHLIYYDDQTRQNVEDKVHMPVDCINIRTGQECRDIQPPDGKSKDCMLQIVCRDGKTISLCAESTDDCLAWKFTLQDSRTNTAYVGSAVMTDETSVVSSPPPYTAYAAPAPEVGRTLSLQLLAVSSKPDVNTGVQAVVQVQSYLSLR